MYTQWGKRWKTPGRINIRGLIAQDYECKLIVLDGSGKNGAFLQKDYLSPVLATEMEVKLIKDILDNSQRVTGIKDPFSMGIGKWCTWPQFRG